MDEQTTGGAVGVSVPPHFGLAVIPQRDAVRVAVRGELDISTSDALRAQLDELWRSGRAEVVVDLREVAFMDSAALCVLVHNHRHATQTGLRFSIVDGPPVVSRLLELTGLNEVFSYAPRKRFA
jgi:anti-anti-sigma factor